MKYEDSKELARNPDTKVRVGLSQREDLRPEILYYLAEDPSTEVRQAIAGNPRTPRQADLLLAKDPDAAVRETLASKVARLTPGLRHEEQEQAERFVVETLELLARDQTVRVRCVLAETLKDVADAPLAVIKTLARDVDELVAAPILEFSPVLSSNDLLEIIAAGCASGRLRAISRRQGLGASVADAIIATDDTLAIAALLENKSAQIREQTLDGLVERAAPVDSWHEPLVGRPQLSDRSARRLAGFVADHLLEQLRARKDLDEATLRLVGQEVSRRLGCKLEDGDADAASEQNDGTSDAELMRAITLGNRAEVCARLATRSRLPQEVVERVVSSGSGKGVTALAWKAKLDMRTAVQIQLRLAGISPTKALQGKDGDEFPMSEEEMDWQIEFFESLSG